MICNFRLIFHDLSLYKNIQIHCLFYHETDNFRMMQKFVASNFNLNIAEVETASFMELKVIVVILRVFLCDLDISISLCFLRVFKTWSTRSRRFS